MAQSYTYRSIAVPVEFQDLQRQLDAANKEIDYYIHQNAFLSAEVKRYRDILCVSCKREVLLATRPISTSLRSSTVTTTAEPTGISPGSGSAVQTPIIKTKTEHSGSDASFAPTSPSWSVPVTFLPVPLSSTPTSTVVPPPSNDQTDCPVDYNPEVKKTLVLSVANTFTLPAEVLCVRFSPDGNYLAVALENEETHVYDVLKTSKSVLVEHCNSMSYSQGAAAMKMRSNLWTVRFSPNGKYIATAGRNGQIKIWEVKRKRIRAIFKGHTSLIRGIDFSPNGRRLASASFDDTIRIWRMCDGSSKRLFHCATSDFNSVSFGPNGRYVAAGNDDRCLRIWDTRTGHLVKKWEGHTDIVRSVVFKSDGKVIVSGGNDHTWKSWDISLVPLRSSGREVNEDVVVKESLTGKGHTDSITSISLSSDNRWVVTSSSSLDCTSRIWDATTGLWVCSLKGHGKCVWAADFCPAGEYVVTGGTDRQVILWRYEVGE